MTPFDLRRARITDATRLVVYEALEDGPMTISAIADKVDASTHNVRERLFELEKSGHVTRTRQVRNGAGGIQYVWHLPDVAVESAFYTARKQNIRFKEDALKRAAPARDPLTAALFGPSRQGAA